MISALWLRLLDGLEHYVILPGAVANILLMTNNIMDLGYTYSKRRIKNPPDVFC